MSLNNQSPGADATNANAEAAFGNSFTSERNDAQHQQNNNPVQHNNCHQEATLLHDDDEDNASSPYEVIDDDTSSDYSDDDNNKATVSCRGGGTGRTKTTTTTSSLKKKKRTWDDSLELLSHYKKRHGHVCVPRSYSDDPRLGEWVNSQRKAYSRKQRGVENTGQGPRITQAQVKRLNAIGFLWQAPRGRQGHKGPHEREEDRQGQQQQALVMHQGNKHEYRNDLSSDHSHQKKSTNQSQTLYTSVLQSQQGSWAVQSHPGRQKLSSKLRAAYLRNESAHAAQNSPRLPQGSYGAYDDDDDDQQNEEEKEETFEGSKDNPATTSTTATITDPGPPSKSSPNRRTWDESFEELLKHKDGKGHLRVSRSYDPRLCEWVRSQRKAYRNGRISQTRRDRLNQIDFVWNPHSSQQKTDGDLEVGKRLTGSSPHATMSPSAWEEMYSQLESHREKYGHTYATQQTSPKLKNWIRTQRAAFSRKRRGVENQGQPITQSQIQLLNKLGFVWHLQRPRKGPSVPDEQLKDAEGKHQNKGGGHVLEQETRRSSAPEPSEENGIAFQGLEAGRQLNIGKSNQTSDDSNASSLTQGVAAAVMDAACTPQQDHIDTSILDGILFDEILQRNEAQEIPMAGGESLTATSTSTESIEGNAGATPAAAVLNVQNAEPIPHCNDGSIPMGDEKKLSSDPLVQQMVTAKHAKGGESASTEAVEDNAGAALRSDDDSSGDSKDKKKSSSPAQEEPVQNQLEKGESNSRKSSEDNAGATPGSTVMMDVQTNSQVAFQVVDNSSSLDDQNRREFHSTEKGTTGATPSDVALGATTTTTTTTAHEEHEDETMESTGIDSVAHSILKPPPSKRQRTNPTAFDTTNDATYVQKMRTTAFLANDATRRVSVASSSSNRQHHQQSDTESDEEPTTRSQPKDDKSQDKSPSSMLETGDEESHQIDGDNQQNHHQRKHDEVEEPVAPLTDKQKIVLFVRKLRLSKHSDESAEAMGLLSSVVLGGPDLNGNRTVAFHCGAHALVVQAMELYQDCPDIQHRGCCVLAGITTLPDTKEVITEMDGLRACLSAIERCPDHPPLLAAACNLIVNLLQCPGIRKTVVDDGGLTVMIKVMKSLKQCLEVQLIGCNALLHLALSLNEASSWAEAVVDAGGIDIVIQAMEGHPNNAELQKNGCTFLATLAKSQEYYRERIFRAKGLAVIANILWVHQSNEIVWEEAQEANKAIIGA